MKRLYRSRTDRMLFGVAGGMARYFEVDVVLVRLLWVLAVLSGPGIPVYLIAAIIIPDEPKPGYQPPGFQPKGGAPEQPAERSETGAGSQSEPREAAAGEQRGTAPEADGGRSSRLFGAALILFGLYFLMRSVLPGWWWSQFWWFSLDRLWPLILVALGLAIILRRHPK